MEFGEQTESDLRYVETMKALRRLVYALIIFSMAALSLKIGAAPQDGASGYNAFRKAFHQIELKPMYLTFETRAEGPALQGTTADFLMLKTRKAKPAFFNGPFEPVAEFRFAKNLDAFLIKGPSELNDRNISLVIFRDGGQLMDIVLVAGRKGDEGYYDEQFGWIRDLNGDGIPELLLDEQLARLSQDASYEEYLIKPLRQKSWNGERMVSSKYPVTKEILKVIEENVGTFRLEWLQSWTSDPRARSAAIHSYENWIKLYPSHSQIAIARSRLQELRNSPQ